MPATAPEIDPWFVPDAHGFSKVDFTPQPQEPEEHQTPELKPEILTDEAPAPEAEPEATVPTPEPEADDEPLFVQNPDGSRISMEKSSKGWKGTVDIGTGSTQVFYGKTKNDLIQNVLIAQLNATKKIREQNKTIKLGAANPEVPTAVKEAEKLTGRTLTADESFEIKSLMETDPDKGLDAWFKKRTGRTVDELVAKAEAGEKAQRELYMESVHKQFLANNPDYYPDKDYKNYTDILAYLAKTKLGRQLNPSNQQEIIDSLIARGQYTVQNLDDAFKELTEDGLLLQAPRPAPVAPAPPPAAPPERIVRTETRPRAGLGIRASETTQAPPAPQQPPTVEDFDSWTTEQIEAEIARYKREAMRNRR